MSVGVSAPEMFTSQVGRDVPGRLWTVPVTVVIHGLVIAAIVVLPLLANEVLPQTASGPQAFFVTPTYAAPPPPPPPPPAAARSATTQRVAPVESNDAFTAPVEVPETVPDAMSLDLGIEGGVPGGVEGGVPGGVVGGVVGGLEDAAPPPPPQAIRVGGVVSEPKKVKHVPPVYPDWAQKARIQGIVILECMISPRGQVQDVKILRGIRLLDEAAVEAVRQWVYTPTLVNGVPTPVLMTVTVNFRLEDA